MSLSIKSEDMNNEERLLENPPYKEKKTHLFTPMLRQIFLASGPIALMLCAGISLGTATVMVPQIKASNGSIQLTQEMESWLYSIHGIAATPSVLTLPYISQVKGYKFAFILICFPILISYILQYLATNAIHLLIANILQGFTMGGNLVVGVNILSEFADPKYRGTFLVFKSATYCWGMWISNAIGTFSSWRNIPLVGIWPPIYALVSCFIWPESPYWLASKHKMEECKKAFRWIRGQSRDAENELALLTSRKPVQQRSKSTLTFLKSIIFLRQFYMPFCLNIAMFFLYQSCAKFVFQAYVLEIIKDITKSKSAAYSGMLILDGVTVFGMYIGSYVAAKVRRRTMYLSTIASTIFFLYLLSAYLYLIQFKVILQNNTASLGLLILYSFSVSWGPMVLCPSIFSEITPLRFKTFITSITVCFMLNMQTALIKTSPFIFRKAGINGAFAVYATLTLFPLIFLYKYLPETRNRTLEGIEHIFEKVNKHDNELKMESLLN